MLIGDRIPFRRIVVEAATFLLCLLTISTHKTALAQTADHVFQTAVTPLAGEDIARPCKYEIKILSRRIKIRGVFVVFDRGPDTRHFYTDPEVLSFAQKHDLAMMMPFHCAAKDQEDMDIDPTKGLGRALFEALDQFAAQSNRPELKTAPVILLGFSGAGAFADRLASFAPDRIAAAILSHAGQSAPLGLETIDLLQKSLMAPELIIVGGKDQTVGTESGYAYFSRYWSLGAPWLFATQNNAGHCCTSDARNLILRWLDGILRKRLQVSGGDLAPLKRSEGYYAFFQKSAIQAPGGRFSTSNAVDLSFQRTEGAPQSETPAGWLPSKQTAREWVALADRTPSAAAVQ